MHFFSLSQNSFTCMEFSQGIATAQPCWAVKLNVLLLLRYLPASKQRSGPEPLNTIFRVSCHREPWKFKFVISPGANPVIFSVQDELRVISQETDKRDTQMFSLFIEVTMEELLKLDRINQ